MQVIGERQLTRYRLQQIVNAREKDLLNPGQPAEIAQLEAYAEGTASQLLYLQVSHAAFVTLSATMSITYSHNHKSPARRCLIPATGAQPRPLAPVKTPSRLSTAHSHNTGCCSSAGRRFDVWLSPTVGVLTALPHMHAAGGSWRHGCGVAAGGVSSGQGGRHDEPAPRHRAPCTEVGPIIPGATPTSHSSCGWCSACVSPSSSTERKLRLPLPAGLAAPKSAVQDRADHGNDSAATLPTGGGVGGGGGLLRIVLGRRLTHLTHPDVAGGGATCQVAFVAGRASRQRMSSAATPLLACETSPLRSLR